MITNIQESKKRNPDNNLATKYRRGVGRPKGASEYPTEFRALIGSLARVSGIPATAGAFNLSTASPSNYKNGKVNHADESPRADLVEKINQVLEPVHNLAIQKTIDALNAITSDKLQGAKAKDAAQIAASLSVVVDRVRPIVTASDEKPQQQINVGVQVYKPEAKSLTDFETVTVKGNAV